jgi:hypothetical protein
MGREYAAENRLGWAYPAGQNIARLEFEQRKSQTSKALAKALAP